jgi:hypothetical protein
VTVLTKQRFARWMRLEVFLAFALLALVLQLFPPLGKKLLPAMNAVLMASNIWLWSWWQWFLLSSIGLSVSMYLRYGRSIQLDWSGRLCRVGSPNVDSEDLAKRGIGWVNRCGFALLVIQLVFLVRTYPEVVLSAGNFTEWNWAGWTIAFLTLTCITSAARYGPGALQSLQSRYVRSLEERQRKKEEQERLDRIKRDNDLRERFERRLPYT